jgi:hypothetical protein
VIFSHLCELGLETPKNSDRDDEKTKIITSLRTTVDGLKEKCMKLSQALDKSLVAQRESQL